MQFLENEIAEVTQSVWSTVVGVSVHRRVAPEAEAGTGRTLEGSVQITGAWEGAVALSCSATLARKAAATMFGLVPEAASTTDTQDAIGELTNMTGGNIKSLLPEPCRLSLPTVVEGTDYTLRVPGSRLVSEVAFECDGQSLIVRLVQKTVSS
jgi:CheY-specific phosphatase CheX